MGPSRGFLPYWEAALGPLALRATFISWGCLRPRAALGYGGVAVLAATPLHMGDGGPVVESTSSATPGPPEILVHPVVHDLPGIVPS